MIPFITILNPCVVMTCVVHINRCINEWHCHYTLYIDNKDDIFVYVIGYK